MKRSYLFSPIYYLLFLVVFITACNSQNKSRLTEDSNTESELIAIDPTLEGDDVLRVDSVLQFNVMITSIFEDSRGHFWFGSHGDGLCRYDGKQYTYFTANHGLPSGAVLEFAPGPDWSKTRKINSGNQISSIQEDKHGNILIMTGGNFICKFDGQNFNIIEPTKQSFLLTNMSNKEWEKELDCLWFGPWNMLGVYRYDGNKVEHLIFPIPYSSVNGISEIYKDNEGDIWFGTMDYGTFRYDGKSFTSIFKDEIGICRSVFQDDTGRIWITNNLFSLYYLEGDSLTNFNKEYELYNKSLKPNELNTGFQAIEQDQKGNLWFGTFGNGLWRYDGEELTHFTDDNSLLIDVVKTIYKDKRGNLWYGIGEGSVYGFDGKSFYRFDGKESIN